MTSNVRGLVLAEAITGGVLIALLVVCGNWLIGSGLAPLRRMASTAALITRSGDLAARMPDAGDREETGRLAVAINTMLDRIQQAFDARLRSEQKVRQFAADASHELRTPLTTIRGYAELYRANALGPDALPNAMRRIEQEAERMSMLVAELLELARLDRPSSLDLTETDLTVLALDAVADARAVEPDRDVRTVGAAQPGRHGRRAADQAGAGQPAEQRPGAYPVRHPGRGPAVPGRHRRGHRGQRRGSGHVGTRHRAGLRPLPPRRGRARGGRRPAPVTAPATAVRTTGPRRRAAASACPSCRRSPPRTAGRPAVTSAPGRAPPSACGSRSGPRGLTAAHSGYRTLVPYISPSGSASSSRRTPSGSSK